MKKELDRAKVVDSNFIKALEQGQFPEPRTQASLDASGLSANELISLFASQLQCRQIDLAARELKQQGIGYYTIASSGHEANAAVAAAFRYTDPAFLHYRSSAFMLQRAKQISDYDELECQLLSLVAARDDPIAGGRHKVFGSLALTVPPQTSTIASHLPKAMGTAFSITRAKELGITPKFAQDSVVLVSFGDASLNHSTAQGAINAAQWLAYNNYPLPLVFVCEDNNIGVSTPTPKNWVEDIISQRPGIHYLSCDGLSLTDTYRAATQAAQFARSSRKPVFLHVKLVRLLGHAGSDFESHYWSWDKIAENEAQDPLLHSARDILQLGLLSKDQVRQQYYAAKQAVADKLPDILKRPKLTSAQQVKQSLIPAKRTEELPSIDEGKRKQVFAEQYTQLKQPRNLCRNLNAALIDILAQYPNTLVFGEDVGRKGGVYQVTSGLQAIYGQRRVFDSILDEQSILGIALGCAQNGFIPIPEIQYLAYLHNAEDQLRGEAATLSFFSNGQYTNPMVIRIASLAYQKGFGGHFHNDNSIAVLRDLPGVIVVCPSNGADAARLLRRAVQLAAQEQRVVVFLEPIALYMTKDLHENGDGLWLCSYPEPHEVADYHEVQTHGDGKDLVILTYGNGYYLSRQAEKILAEQHGVACKLVDIQWLHPLPMPAILREIQAYQRVLIVDEGRKTGSVSEELISLLLEQAEPVPMLKRITGDDCFIPLGKAWEYVLPSCQAIVDTVLKMI